MFSNLVRFASLISNDYRVNGVISQALANVQRNVKDQRSWFLLATESERVGIHINNFKREIMNAFGM